MLGIVGSDILIKDASGAVRDWCQRSLVIDNPEYSKKQRMGLWIGSTPKQISLYERIGHDVRVPFGCILDLVKLGVPLKSSITSPERFLYDSRINLYEYQEKAVKEALERKNGVLVMPCGAGKTQTALEIIARLGVRALWITHTQDLLNQSKARAEAVFDCDKTSYGTITAGKVNIGSGLTFATVQTLAKLDLTKYKDAWGCIVVDECHKAVGSPTKAMQFYKALSGLSCRYKFGVTATPERADGLSKSMYSLLGGKIIEIDRDAVAATTCDVRVRKIMTSYTPDLSVALSGDGTLNYASLVDDLTHNEQRLYDVALKTSQVSETGATLLLANRVEYLKRLAEILEKAGRRCVCLSAMGQSKAAKAARREALRKLNDGEIDCVLCTYQLAAEGLDCPNLKYVVFATPEKDPTRIQQASGRVGRKADGKKLGTVIDFIDNFGMYKGWAKKRESVYKKLGYEVISYD